MFLTNARFREGRATGGPVVVWLNVDSKNKVDELYRRWKVAGARIRTEAGRQTVAPARVPGC
jgi:uncharacterized glyoxalase superfamily protein PhnB